MSPWDFRIIKEIGLLSVWSRTTNDGRQKNQAIIYFFMLAIEWGAQITYLKVKTGFSFVLSTIIAQWIEFHTNETFVFSQNFMYLCIKTLLWAGASPQKRLYLCTYMWNMILMQHRDHFSTISGHYLQYVCSSVTKLRFRRSLRDAQQVWILIFS